MISVTALCSYIYCPRKLYLEKVLGFLEPPKAALVKGKIQHDILESINKNEEKLVVSIVDKISLPDIKEKYLAEYLLYVDSAISKYKKMLSLFNLSDQDISKNAGALIEAEAERRSRNVFQYMEKFDIFGEELWKQLTPKILSELAVQSKVLRLKGIVDQIELYPDAIIPIEFKTGKMPREGVWPSHRVQIAAYALLLQETHNIEIREGFVVYLNAMEKRGISINPFLKEEVIELINKVESLLQLRELPPVCDNTNKCSVCGLKNECHNQGKLEKQKF